jgi:acetolactate synthase-1/2/3 large subunit
VKENNEIQLVDYLSNFISENGISDVFQLSGGMITQIIDKISQNPKIKVHTLFHEQSCAFAVSAYGRIHKTPSIAFATSGPGATNLLTGIGDCYFDSVPAIFITGQVNTFELKGNRSIRQLGFQETDIVSMAKPITKLAIQLDESSDFVEVFENAYNTAINGRPGPVLIDIPMNVQRQKIKSKDKSNREIEETSLINNIELISNLLKDARKPIIWAGNGIHTSDSEVLFNEFVEKTKIPAVLSLHAIDLLPSTSKYRVGMIGSYGNRWANKIVKESDLIFFIGTRVDIRQTGANLSIFENKKIIHIDIEQGEINNRVSSEFSVVSDLKDFLLQFITHVAIEFDYSNWLDEIVSCQNDHPILNELKTDENEINPHKFFELISKSQVDRIIYTVDVGSHQMWSAQSLFFKKEDRFLTSGGMGSMGFSLPAAIGAAVSTDAQVIVIVGDGSFQMNIQELQYIQANQLNIKIIVVNNESLGMIRQFQDSYMEGRYFGTKWGYSTPDFVKIASAYGIPSEKIKNDNEIDTIIEWFNDGSGPKLLELSINSNLDVYPKIAFGQTMDKMEPEFKPNQIEST